MSLRSSGITNRVLQTIRVIIAVVAIVVVSATTDPFLRAQSPHPWVALKVSLPDESVGIDRIVQTLISVFDEADVIALGEAHGRFRKEGDLRIALIRNPDFARKVRSIVVEFASTTAQATLNRYIRREKVSSVELAQVWKTTTQAANGNDIWNYPIYPEFFAAVRDVNQKLTPDQQILVLGADPGQGSDLNRDAAAVSVIRAAGSQSFWGGNNAEQSDAGFEVVSIKQNKNASGIRLGLWGDRSWQPE